MPLDIKKAYANGTRSFDGSPGKNYWQNSSDYKINVTILPAKKMLQGDETIAYHNNSPDTLKVLWFRLYQNIYQKGAPREFSLHPSDLHDGIHFVSMSLGGNSFLPDTAKNVSINATIMHIELDKPLLPHESLKLGFKWEVTLPSESQVRMGVYDSTTAMVAYWYPQVSVYDDVHGWDTEQYTGSTEFYNDFNNYDVSITIPNAFCTWATGILQNSSAVLAPQILSRYTKAQSSEEVVKIITPDDLDTHNFNTSASTNTWHYLADNVTDFAFAYSDHYLWDAVTAIVDSTTKRSALISAAYNPKSIDFYEVADIARKVIQSYSFDFPKIPFPYPRMTVFNGSGGMEFPMMVNDGSSNKRSGTVYLTAHEIGHTYFPFYMGTNERKYAFMDEGWATILPEDLLPVIEPTPSERAKYLAEGFARVAGNEDELPLVIPSTDIRGNGTYRVSAYTRPGLAYKFLRNALGTEVFLKGLHTYVERWHGKHPIPYDFYYSVESGTHQKLDWYWKPWFFDFSYPDLAIRSVKSSKDIKITVEKIGGMPVPVVLTLTFENGKKKSINADASIWKDGKRTKSFSTLSEGKLIKVELGAPEIPDVDSTNNMYESKR